MNPPIARSLSWWIRQLLARMIITQIRKPLKNDANLFLQALPAVNAQARKGTSLTNSSPSSGCIKSQSDALSTPSGLNSNNIIHSELVVAF